MSQSPQLGQIIDEKFELLETLGSGGIGAVFKANQLNCNRTVALKLLHPQFAEDREYKERFLREAKSLSQLSHSGIVTVYQLGLSKEGQLYIAMELVEGQSLKKLLNASEKLSTMRALRIIRDAALALEYVHSKGIVHRDIKPDNIILSNVPAADTVKVIDFGLVNLAELTDQKLTKTNTLLGTAAYMSPEQCAGKKVDRKSDIYSLSLCLFETLTGRLPFVSDTPIGVMYKTIHDPVPQISPQMVERFDPILQVLLDKGLEKEPEKRYQSMADFAEKLSNAICKLEDDKDSRFNLMPLAITVGMLTLIIFAYIGIRPLIQKQFSKQRKAIIVDTIRSSPIQQIRDLKQKMDTGNKLQLISDCYQIVLNDNVANIPRVTKLNIMLEFADRLNKIGLPINAIAIYQKTIDDVKKFGFPQISTVADSFGKDELSSAESGKADEYIECGEISKAKEIVDRMYQSGTAAWDTLADVSSRLHELQTCKKCIEKCANRPGQLLKLAPRLRINNNIEAYKYCLSLVNDAAEQSSITETRKALLSIEQAHLAIILGQKANAIKLLDEISREKLQAAEKKQKLDLVSDISNLYSALECFDKALAILKLVAPDDLPKPHKVERKLSQEEITAALVPLEKELEKKRNRARTLEQIDSLIASAENPYTLACLYSTRAAATETKPLKFYFDCLSYFVVKQDKSNAVPNRVRLLLTLDYADNIDSDTGLATEALPLYLQVIDKAQNDEAKTESFLSGKDLTFAQLKAATVFKDWGELERARRILFTVKHPLPPNSHAIPLLNVQLELGMTAEAKNTIQSWNEPSDLVRMAKVCISHHKMDLAQLCVNKGLSLLQNNKMEKTEVARLRKQFALSSTFIFLESGEKDKAKECLRKLEDNSKVADKTAAIQANRDQAAPNRNSAIKKAASREGQNQEEEELKAYISIAKVLCEPNAQ